MKKLTTGRRIARYSYRRLRIEKFECRHLLASGDLDLTFDQDGIVTTEFDDSQTSGKVAIATAIQTDGKIVAIGEGALVRYQPNGALDSSFGNKGKVAVAFDARDVAVQSDGRIVVAGNAKGSAQMAVARFSSLGQLDTTFDGDGTAFVDLGPQTSASSLVIQPDGKIVVAGSGTKAGQSSVAAVRLLSDGALDSAFGSQGKAIYSLNQIDIAYDVALQANGRIVLVGRTGFFTGTTYEFDFLAVRLLSNGKLDHTFDGDGWLTRNASPVDRATGVAIQSNGLIIVAGATHASSADTGAYVTRLHADGSTDTSFDGDGVQQEAFQLYSPGAEDVLVDATGKILLVGTAANRIAMVRYNSNGSLDQSFGSEGKVTVPNGLGRSVSRQADGSFIVGGANQGSFGLARFLGNGSLDTAFSLDGLVQTDLGPSVDEIAGIVIQPDLKTIAVGQSGRTLSLARYELNGSLDTSFGDGGKLALGLSERFRTVRANSVALQNDGKIIVAGFAVTVVGDIADSDFLVARLLSNGMLDPSFSSDGWLTTDSGGYEVANSVLIQPDGKIVIGGSDNSGFAFARYTADGKLDPSFNHDGKRSLRFGQNFSGVTKVLLQPDGAIIGAGNIFYSNSSNGASAMAIVRLLPNGSNDNSFNGSGRLVDKGNAQRLAYDASLQSDGSILVAGGSNYRPQHGAARINMAVTKLLSTGARDLTFGTGGTTEIVFSSPSVGMGIAIQADGRIIVGGQAASDFAVARLNTNGAVDTSFADAGKVTTHRGTYGVKSADIAILPDGRLLLAGSDRDYLNGELESDFNLIRYLNDPVIPEASSTERKNKLQSRPEPSPMNTAVLVSRRP